MLLQPGSHPEQRVAVPAADRDDETVPDEDRDLTGLNIGCPFDISEGPQHDEQVVVILLDLGPLVATHRVLHRERVELETAVDERELVIRGVLEADPEEAVLLRPKAREVGLQGRAGSRRPSR